MRVCPKLSVKTSTPFIRWLLSVILHAPIVLFVYNRPWHTRQTVEALARNTLARESDLVVYSDGPRSDADRSLVEDVRQYVRTISGFRNVEVIERDGNWGLAKSIIAGVTEAVNRHGRVIVLEDDMITSPFFLHFMNDALEVYREQLEVVCIHGYTLPVREVLPEYFLLRGADCWGWATWRRGWDIFESDGLHLLDELKRRRLTHAFDFDGTYPYTQMLEDQTSGRNDSWAIRWHASAFLAGKFTLYSGRSHVMNIGLDGSGCHCGTAVLQGELAEEYVSLPLLPPVEDRRARQAYVGYHRRNSRMSLPRRLMRRVRDWGLHK